jgi:hypothetical protein
MRYAADCSAFLQHAVRRGYSIAAKTKLRGQRSFTGQTVAGQQPAESDLLLYIPRDLRKQEISFGSHQANTTCRGRHG